MIGVFGTVLCLLALAYLVYKGYSVIVISPVLAVFIFLFNGYPVYDGMIHSYVQGAGQFFQNWILYFLLCALFGNFMKVSGAAAGVARTILNRFGVKLVFPAIMLMIGILAMGGISGFVLMFAVLPFMAEFFKRCNIPRKMYLAVLGTTNLWLYCPGSPQMLNVLPTQFLETTPNAGLTVGLVCVSFAFILDVLYLNYALKRYHKKGIGYEYDPADSFWDDKEETPPLLLCILPLLTIFVTYAFLKFDILVSTLLGVCLAFVCYFKKLIPEMKAILTETGNTAVMSAINTGMVVALASAFTVTEGYQMLIDLVTKIDFSPYLSSFIAVNLIVSVTGSATGAVSIVMPNLAPIFIERFGANAAALHRVSVISANFMDSMPHNGWIISVNTLTNLTHKDSYFDFAVCCLFINGLAAVLSVMLFTMFPVLVNF